MQNTLLIFIHLTAAGIGMGSLIYALFLFLPAMEKLPERELPEEETVHYKTMEILQPTVFTCLLILVGTGIYYLLQNYTDQVNLKPGYYNLFGIKMIFVIAAFFLSAYQTFSVKARIANLDINPEKRQEVPATLQKLKTLSQITLTAMLIAFFIGVWLARY